MSTVPTSACWSAGRHHPPWKRCSGCAGPCASARRISSVASKKPASVAPHGVVDIECYGSCNRATHSATDWLATPSRTGHASSPEAEVVGTDLPSISRIDEAYLAVSRDSSAATKILLPNRAPPGMPCLFCPGLTASGSKYRRRGEDIYSRFARFGLCAYELPRP